MVGIPDQPNQLVKIKKNVLDRVTSLAVSGPHCAYNLLIGIFRPEVLINGTISGLRWELNTVEGEGEGNGEEGENKEVAVERVYLDVFELWPEAIQAAFGKYYIANSLSTANFLENFRICISSWFKSKQDVAQEGWLPDSCQQVGLVQIVEAEGVGLSCETKK